MKRLWLLAICLLMALPSASAATSAAFLGGGSGPAPMTYLLRCFSGTTADQSFFNGQVIDTAAEGCIDGSLYVYKERPTGTSSSVSNVLSLLTPDYFWPQNSVSYTSAITRSIGTGVFATITSGNTDEYRWLGIHTAYPVSTTNRLYEIGYNSTGYITLEVYSNGTNKSQGFTSSSYSAGTAYPSIIVTGGYSSGGLPYYSGQTKADYFYGSSAFVKISGTWNLIAKTSTSNSNIVPAIHSAAKNNATLVSSILIPNYDFSDILQPTHLSLFATDGELSAYTPDVGSAWTENAGDWDTASGKLVNTTAGIATFDAGVATAIYDATITTPASGTTNGGMIARYVDSTHYWLIELDDTNNLVVLYEKNGAGDPDARASTAVTLAANTAYKVRVIVSSTSPYWSIFVDGVAAGTYTTAGSSSTATKFGLYDLANANIVGFDVVGLWARTSSVVDAAFALVGY